MDKWRCTSRPRGDVAPGPVFLRGAAGVEVWARSLSRVPFFGQVHVKQRR